MPPLDGQCPPQSDLQIATDLVIGSFGLPLTAVNLSQMAAEMERRVHIFRGGPVLAMRIVAELHRRAVAQRRV